MFVGRYILAPLKGKTFDIYAEESAGSTFTTSVKVLGEPDRTRAIHVSDAYIDVTAFEKNWHLL
jgi:hypothetical protein